MMFLLYGVVYVKHGEKGRGRSTNELFLVRFLFLIGLCASAVVWSFCGSVCCSWGFGRLWGALPVKAVMDEHSFLLEGA